MIRGAFKKTLDLLLAGWLVGLLLVCSAGIQADQAQYFFDELGRLVGVVDGKAKGSSLWVIDCERTAHVAPWLGRCVPRVSASSAP